MKPRRQLQKEARDKLKAKTRHELKKKAKQEISKLLTGLRTGTLSAKTLKSGLRKVHMHIQLMPNHDWYHHR
jgi:uncharacterized membrane protein